MNKLSSLRLIEPPPSIQPSQIRISVDERRELCFPFAPSANPLISHEVGRRRRRATIASFRTASAAWFASFTSG